jgi:hypothetical protein
VIASVVVRVVKLAPVVLALLTACSASAGTTDAAADGADVATMESGDRLDVPAAMDTVDAGTPDVPAVTDALDVSTSCVGTIVPGGACATTAMCSLPAACRQCSAQLYIVDAPGCACTGGRWQCDHVDCFGPGPGVFTDPGCTVPSVRDAGAVDAPDAADASPVDACGGFSPPDAMIPETGACPLGTTLCLAECVDLRSDPRNCGACGRTCLPAQVCSLGSCACECPKPLTVCNTGCDRCHCVDVLYDTLNCGGCGIACPAGEVCSNAMCVAPDAGRD